MTEEEEIDLVLKGLVGSQSGMLDVQRFLSLGDGAMNIGSYRKVIRTLVSHNLVIQKGTSPVVELLPLGNEVFESGGINQYIKRIENEENEKNRLNRLQTEDTEIKLKLNKFYFKYRWLPFALSISALIVSLLVAIFK